MTVRRRPWIAGPLLAGGLLLAACSPQAAGEPVATDQVTLPPSYRFEPAAITVPDGTTVTWTNSDNFTHNVRLLDDGAKSWPCRPVSASRSRSPGLVSIATTARSTPTT